MITLNTKTEGFLGRKDIAAEVLPRLILGGGTCFGTAVTVSVFATRKDQSPTDIST